MSIPTEVKNIICDMFMDMVQEWSCDEFTVENTEENRQFAKLIYGDDYYVDGDGVYLSLYSILKYWRDQTP